MWEFKWYRQFRDDIAILFMRTDKRTKEFELERQVRVGLSREVRQLRDRVRVLERDMKCWRWAIKNPKFRKLFGEQE